MASKRLEIEIVTDSKGAQRGIADLDGPLSGFGTKLTGIGTIATAAGQLLSQGLQMGLDKAIELVQFLPQLGEQFDAVYDDIRIGTGATGAVFEGLQQNVRNLMGEVPLAMEQIGPAVDILFTKLGLTGQGLEDVAESALNFARMVGEDPTQSVEDIADVFNNWGVSAGDMVPTLDMLLRTYQSTGIGLSELTGGLTGAGLQMQEMGFSITEASALLGNLDKVGMSSSDVLMGMNRVMAEAAVTGKPAAQMFRDLMDSIRSGDPAAAAEAIELLGTRSGGKFVAMVKDGTLAWDDLAASLSAGGDTINGLADETDDWSQKWQLIKNDVFLALEGPASEFFDGIGRGMDKIKEGKPDEAFNEWKAALGNVFSQLGDLWAQVWPLIEPELIKLKDQVVLWWNETGSPMVSDALGAALGAAWDAALAWAWGRISDPTFWINAFEWLRQIITGFAGSLIGAFTGWVSEGTTKLAGLLNTAWDAVWQWLSSMPGKIWNAAQGMWDGITSAFKSAINAIIGMWNDFRITFKGFDIPGPGPNIPGFTIDTPNIPFLAEGGSVVSSGVAMVGERGPELVDLPRGADVIPLDRPMGGTTIIVNLNVEGSVLTEQKLVETVRHGLLQQSRYKTPLAGVS